MPGRRHHALRRRDVDAFAVDADAARRDQRLGRPGLDLGQPQPHELVDIAVIVGQQHPGLHRAPVRAGVVDQPAQRIIDPDRVEQGEWARLALDQLIGAVGDLVADQREQRRREIAREFGGGDLAASEFVAAFERVGIGDFLAADAGLDRRAIFRDERPELVEQIGAEFAGLRHRGRVDPRGGEFGVAAPRRRRQLRGLVGHAQHRIAIALAIFQGRRLAGVEEALQVAAERRARLVIEPLEPIDGGFGGRCGLEAHGARILLVRF